MSKIEYRVWWVPQMPMEAFYVPVGSYEEGKKVCDILANQANLNLQMQAQIHACEADTQTATVRDIYQICTGKTGEPGDWNGAKPVAVALKKERDKALEEAAQIASTACLVPPDGGSPTEAEANVCDEAAKRIRALKDKGA